MIIILLCADIFDGYHHVICTITVAVQRDDVLCVEHLDEEAVVVVVDADGEDAEGGGVDGAVLLKPLHVVHVDQGLGASLKGMKKDTSRDVIL